MKQAFSQHENEDSRNPITETIGSENKKQTRYNF